MTVFRGALQFYEMGLTDLLQSEQSNLPLASNTEKLLFFVSDKRFRKLNQAKYTIQTHMEDINHMKSGFDYLYIH